MTPLTFDVGPEQAGQRLDRFLVSVLESHSRSQIQRLIAEGQVTLGSRAAKSNTALKAGEQVQVDVAVPTPSSLEREDVPLDVLYQDGDVAVINKPAGMVVHPGAGHPSGTLVNALLHHMEDLSGI